MQKKLESIQYLRAFAAMAVVICHAAGIERIYGYYRFLPSVGTFGVDLFFVISGFVITYSCWDKLGQPDNIKSFIKNRFLRIYPVYWEFSILVLIGMEVIPSITIRALGPTDIFQSLILYPMHPIFPGANNRIINVGWSLVFEMYFYLMFCFAFIISQRYFLAFIVAWSGLILLNFDANTTNIAYSPLTLEFIAGCVIGVFSDKIKNINPIYFILLSIIWVISFFSLFNIDPNKSDAIRLWAMIPSCCLLLCAAITGENKYPSLFSAKFPILLGNASYSIYLCHAIVLGFLGKIWAIFAIKGVMAHILFVISIIGISTFCGVLNYIFVEKRLLSYKKSI